MDQLESMIKQVILEMQNGSGTKSTATKPSQNLKFTYADYPLGEKRPEVLKTPTGKSINEVTLEAVLNNKISAQDVRITPETLEMQAQVAKSRGRDIFAQNLIRASELIAIPDERILQMYTALRPYQSTRQELSELAKELREKYNANITADLVDEAAQVYETRGRLKQERV